MRGVYYSIIYFLWKLVNLPRLLRNKVTTGKDVRIRGRIFIKTPNFFSKRKSIYIHDGVTINSSLASDPIGGDNKTILCTRENGSIVINEGVGMSNTTIVAQTKVVIGENSNLGGGTKIYDTDFHSIDSKIRLNGDYDVKTLPVTIGSRVFVGAHSIILKGVTIGDDAVIGAGSIVSKDIPAGEIWAGNPAKFIKRVV